MGLLKWGLGVLGWSVGGVIGGIIGFAFGSIFENVSFEKPQISSGGKKTETTEGDFAVSLLVLSAKVMKADGQLLRSELDFVKEFFKNNFGVQKATQYILLFREILKKDYDTAEVCVQIRRSTTKATRLQLLHYLFGVALSDGVISKEEEDEICRISNYLGINAQDYLSVRAMYIKVKHANTTVIDAYAILEIPKTATDEEIKKAYKKMAMKHHPDKVANLGEDVQRAANEKFKKINEAYEYLKNERGFK